MKILVRLPNWLGDMVMSTGFVRALRSTYPSAEIDVIVKKGLDTLVDFMPEIRSRYIFSKEEWKGVKGVYRFGRAIRQQIRYDLFFCLPDSFSSALMACATGTTQRVGFRKELRSPFLTKSFHKPSSVHRVDEYISLLEQFTKEKVTSRLVLMKNDLLRVPHRIIINFNSEAESRRMPVTKAASILNSLVRMIPQGEFVTIGTIKEKTHVDAILNMVDDHTRIDNKAGQTPELSDLVKVIGSASAMLTTDSGPAHLANALGVPTVVTFGAGDEKNTAPYNRKLVTGLRLGQLPCEPCVRNFCKFGLPRCLEELEANNIVNAVKNSLILK